MDDVLSGIRDAARDLGFSVLGVAPAVPFDRERDALRAWCEAGNAAGMAYMAKDQDRRSDPTALLPGALSIVSVGVNYWSPAPPFSPEGRYGRVSRYAWGLDYHDVMRPRLTALAEAIETRLSRRIRASAPVDSAPILEKAVAARAGLGFVGKHTVLVLPKHGSFWFLGEVLVDVDLPPTPLPRPFSCGSCTKCLDLCPTRAFVAPYRLDARKCIAYWTVEEKGWIPRDFRASIGEWVLGCDLCQEACPFNRFSQATPWEELKPSAGVGPRLDLVETLSIDADDAFRRRFRKTPFLRPKRRGILRNAAIVARNVGAEAAIGVLVERVERDPEPIVRGHALWALQGLAPDRVRRLAVRLREDADASVRAEAEAVLSGAA